MTANKSLKSTLKLLLNTDYRREDNNISNNTVAGGINFDEIAHSLSNGVNADLVNNLQFFKDYTITNATTQTLDWDGSVLTDIWGETLDYTKVKIVILRNIEAITEVNKQITMVWGNEKAVIKAQGFRILGEPALAGIDAVTNDMTLTAGTETTQIRVIALGDDDTASS